MGGQVQKGKEKEIGSKRKPSRETFAMKRAGMNGAFLGSRGFV